MINSLITYTGIDNIDNLNEYEYCKKYILSGHIEVNDEVSELLSFNVSKESIGYKCINTFVDSNYEKVDISGDLIIIHNKFNLSFEYSVINSPRLHILTKEFFKSIYISLEDYYNESFEVGLHILDLHTTLLSSKKIYYCINISNCINCR